MVRPNSTVKLASLDPSVNENVLLKERNDMDPVDFKGCLAEKNHLHVERNGHRPLNLENLVLYAEREEEGFSIAGAEREMLVPWAV